MLCLSCHNFMKVHPCMHEHVHVYIYIQVYACCGIIMCGYTNQCLPLSFLLSPPVVWSEWEQQLKQWAAVYGTLHVITGSVLDTDHNGIRDTDNRYNRWEGVSWLKWTKISHICVCIDSSYQVVEWQWKCSYSQWFLQHCDSVRGCYEWTMSSFQCIRFGSVATSPATFIWFRGNCFAQCYYTSCTPIRACSQKCGSLLSSLCVNHAFCSSS
jgi:hypothetical protein